MNTTWLNIAEERFAQTLSGARLSPYSSGRVLYMDNNHSSRGMFVGVGGLRRKKHSSTAGSAVFPSESCVIQLPTVSFAFCQRGTLA
jgi:hypothetical protein